MRPIVLAGFLAVALAFGGTARSSESIDGDNEAPRQVGGMHGCSEVVSGIDVQRNWLRCSTGYGPVFRPSRVTLQTDQRVIFPPFPGTMLSCRDNEMIHGIHVDNNQFRCTSLDSVTTNLLQRRGFSTNWRNLTIVNRVLSTGMISCPTGMVMIGAHFTRRIIACARPPVCADNLSCEAGKSCRAISPSSLIKVCQ